MSTYVFRCVNCKNEFEETGITYDIAVAMVERHSCHNCGCNLVIMPQKFFNNFNYTKNI